MELEIPNFISYSGRLYGLLPESTETSDNNVLVLTPADEKRSDVSSRANQFLSWLQSNSFYGVTGCPIIQPTTNKDNCRQNTCKTEDIISNMTHGNNVSTDNAHSSIASILTTTGRMETRYNDIFNDDYFPGGLVTWTANKIDQVLGCYDTDDLMSAISNAKSIIYDMMSILTNQCLNRTTGSDLDNARHDILSWYIRVDAFVYNMNKPAESIINRVNTLCSDRIDYICKSAEDEIGKLIKRALTSAVTIDDAAISNENDWYKTIVDNIFNGNCCDYTIHVINGLISGEIVSASDSIQSTEENITIIISDLKDTNVMILLRRYIRVLGMLRDVLA